MVKNLPANAGDSRHKGSILGLGRSPGVGNGNLLQYSCLKFFRQEKLDREVWWATVNGLTKSQTQLVCVHTHTHTHTHYTHMGSQFPEWGSNQHPLPYKSYSQPLGLEGSPKTCSLKDVVSIQWIASSQSHKNKLLGPY